MREFRGAGGHFWYPAHPGIAEVTGGGAHRMTARRAAVRNRGRGSPAGRASVRERAGQGRGRRVGAPSSRPRSRGADDHRTRPGTGAGGIEFRGCGTDRPLPSRGSRGRVQSHCDSLTACSSCTGESPALGLFAVVDSRLRSRAPARLSRSRPWRPRGRIQLDQRAHMPKEGGKPSEPRRSYPRSSPHTGQLVPGLGVLAVGRCYGRTVLRSAGTVRCRGRATGSAGPPRRGLSFDRGGDRVHPCTESMATVLSRSVLSVRGP